MDLKTRDEIIKKYMYLVPILARYIAKQYNYHFDLSNLESEGYVGLIDGATKFQPQTYSYEECKTYLGIRIKGQMKDYIRDNAIVPRRSYERGERAVKVDIDCCLDIADEGQDALDVLIKKEEASYLPEMLECLNQRQLSIVRMYYLDDLTMETIAKKLKVTESAVSITIKTSIGKIKANENKADKEKN